MISKNPCVTYLNKGIIASVNDVFTDINLQGVANRGCSIRVGRETEKQGKGYNTTKPIKPALI